jgi:hypothetical protein
VAQNAYFVMNVFGILFIGIFGYHGIGKYRPEVTRRYIHFAQRICLSTRKYKGFPK